MLTSRLKGRLSLLVLAFAVAMLIFPATAFALEAGGSTSPTIQSDKADYAPGELVTLTGSNWQSGEKVNIFVNDDAGQTWSRNVDVTADASGNIKDQFNLPDWFVATYSVKATGASGAVATTSFTDGNIKVFSSPSGVTFTLAVTEYNNSTTCNSANNGAGGTASTKSIDDNGTLVQAGNNNQSVKLIAPATSDQGGTFTNWSSPTGNNNGSFTTLSNNQGGASGGRAICVQGANTDARHYVATYSVPATDSTAPTTTASAKNADNSTYTSDTWTNQNVTVSLSATDNTGGSGVKEIVYSINGGANTTVAGASATVNITTEGTKTISYFARDNAGNAETAKTFIVKVDKTAPTVTPGDVNDTTWRNSSLSESFTASDSGSGLASNQGLNTNGGFTLTASAESTKDSNGNIVPTTVSKTVSDVAGNSTTRSLSAKIDKTNPVANCGGAPSSWSQSDVSIRCQPTDTLSGLNNPAADGDFNLSTSVSAGTETDNASTNSRVVADAAGNTVTAGPITGIKVDKKAPTYDCGPVDTAWRATDKTYTCTASDGGSGLSTAQATSTPASFSLFTSVAANTEDSNASTNSRDLYDAVGNKATAGPISGNHIDKKAPAVNCGSADGNWHASDVSIACTASDGGSGLANSGDGSFNLSTNVAAGTETANASTNSKSVADAVGNSATAGPISGNKVDKKAPNTTADAGTYNGGWTNQSVTVTLSATDDGSGVKTTEYSLDGGAYQPYTSGISVSSDGEHTILYRSTDNVNNQESPAKSFTVKVDKTAPTITDLGPTSPPNGTNNWYTTNVTNRFQASDSGSGLSDACKANFPLTAGDNVQSKTTSGEGTAVKVSSDSCTDVAGNTAAAKDSALFKVDLTNPTAEHSLSANANANGWHKANVTVTLTASDKDALGGTNASGVNGISYSVNNGAPQPYTNGISLTSDGVYNIKYTATDNAGRTSAEGSLTVRLDKTAPVITDEGLTPASPDGQNGWYVTEVSNGFKASDGLSGFVGQNDPYTFSKSSGIVAHDPAFKINSGTVTDKAGNESLSIDSKTFKIDMQAPDAPNALDLLTSSDTGASQTDNVTSDNTPSFSVKAEAGSTVRIYKDSDPVALGSAVADATGLASPVDSSQLADGSYTIHATATDEAGNVSASSLTIGVKIDPLTVDTQRPDTTITDAPASLVNSRSASFSFSSTEANSTFQCSLDGAAYSSCTSPKSYTDLTDGQHTFSVKATDKAGNTDDTPARHTWDVDATAPTSSHTLSAPANPNGWHKADVTVTLSANDGQGSGVQSIRYSINGGPEQVAAGASKQIPVSNEGMTTITYHAVDKAGNAESPDNSVTVKLDKTSPVITRDGVKSGTLGTNGWYTSAVDYGFKASDPNASNGSSGSGLALADQAFTKPSGANEGSAVQVASGTVTDLAGNPSVSILSDPLKIDLTDPSASHSLSDQPNANGWFKNDVTVTLNATDKAGGSGVQEISYSLNSAPSVTVAGSTTQIQVSSEQENTISYKAKDNAGRVSAQGNLVVKLDKTAPTVTPDDTFDLLNWYKAPVSKSFTASDNGSGLANAGDASFTLTASAESTKDANGNVVLSKDFRTVTDLAGNSTVRTIGAQIDLTKPVINIINAPAEGSTINVCGGTPPTPSFTASDVLSGIATSSDNLVKPDTGTGAGPYTYTAQATDRAGNSDSTSRNYRVEYGAAFGGITQPINGGLTPNDLSDDNSRFKLGSTIPVKFTLTCNGTPVTNAVAKLNIKLSDNKPDPGVDEAISTAASTTGNLFRYDALSGQYIFNLSTKSGYTNPNGTTITSFGQGTYTLSILLDDGTYRSVNINLVR